MTKVKTLFSVIIPTYNRPDYIIRSVSSICSLNRADTEIVVVNDGSTLSYNRFLSLYKSEIKYIENSASFGAARSRNIGTQLSVGEWLVFLDDDDELSDDYLDNLASKIGTSENPSSFWTGAKIISKNGSYERIFPEKYDDNKYLVKDFLSVGTGFGFSINRKIFNDLGKFDESFHIGEDTEFFFNLLSSEYIPTPVSGIGVIKHEEHGDRLNSTFKDYSWNNIYGRIFEKYRNSFCKYRQYNYAHLLMWSYKIHRNYENMEYANADLQNLLKLRIPIDKIEYCYQNEKDIPDEYLL